MKHLLLLCKNILLFVGFLSLAESIFAVNVSPLSTDTLSPIMGDSFTLTASISGAVFGSNYYVKCRIGANSSSLNDGQTYNSQSLKWLDDTGSSGAWIDMPQVSVGSDGVWSGALSCRIKSSSTDESKILFVRACLNVSNSCGTSFQSSNSLTLNSIVPTSTPTPVPTSTPTPTDQPSPTPTRTPTPTPTSITSQAPTVTLASNQTQLMENATLYPSPDNSLDETDEAYLDEDVIESSGGSVLGADSNFKSKDENKNLNSMISVFFGFFAAGFGVFSLASVVYVLRNHSLS